VLLALTSEQEAELLGVVGDDDKSLEIVNAIVERWDEDWLCETDKAWDAIHRAFDSSNLSWNFDEPLQGVILGGKCVYFRDDYLISYKSAEQVREIAAALSAVSSEDMAHRYDLIDAVKYQRDKGDKDRGYTLGWFEPVKNFYQKTAAAGRPVVFTVDQ
jgi:hypothetical protein